MNKKCIKHVTVVQKNVQIKLKLNRKMSESSSPERHCFDVLSQMWKTASTRPTSTQQCWDHPTHSLAAFLHAQHNKLYQLAKERLNNQTVCKHKSKQVSVNPCPGCLKLQPNQFPDFQDTFFKNSTRFLRDKPYNIKMQVKFFILWGPPIFEF